MYLCCHTAITLPSGFWDNLWPQLITGFLSSGAGFAGAYYLFVRNTRLEKLKENRLEEIELQDILRFIKYSMQRLIEPEKKLMESLKSLIGVLEAHKVKDIEFSFKPAFNFQWIEGIDKIKLQKAFLKHIPGTENEKINDYNQFLSLIDYINTINKRLGDDFIRYIDESRRLEWLFDQEKIRIVNVYMPIHAKLLPGAGIEVFTALDEEVNLIFKEWNKIKGEDKKDMFIFYDTLILNGKLENYGWKTKDFDLLNTITNISFAFKSYEKNQKINNTIFSSYLQGIEQSFNTIQGIVGKFENI